MLKNKDFKVSISFRQSVSEALRSCKYSRDEVVSLIYGLTGHKISKSVLDQMTAPSKVEYRFPAEVLPAFCYITGSVEPLKVLAEAVGFEIVDEEESKDLKLLRLMKEKERIEREIAKLKRVAE
jgi:hypothetical protein